MHISRISNIFRNECGKTMKRWIFLFIISGQLLFAQTWVKKISGGGLGNPLAYNPLNTNIIYGSPGSSHIYISRNRGYTWLGFGNPVPGGGSIKSIVVSPLDTSQILAGVEMGNSVPDRIMKTTDDGFTWIQTWGGSFSYYGQPIEFKSIHPDTVYTMGSDTLWRSTDFGTTWDTVKTTFGITGAWCDAELRPDSANIMYIGDAARGIWKTANYGQDWKKVYVTSGEIPSIAIDPLNPRVAYATKYSGGGGIVKTTNWGETWNAIATPINTGSTWWIVCSPVQEGFVYFGTYGSSPAGIYMSRDSGGSWQNFNIGLDT